MSVDQAIVSIKSDTTLVPVFSGNTCENDAQHSSARDNTAVCSPDKNNSGYDTVGYS